MSRVSVWADPWSNCTGLLLMPYYQVHPILEHTIESHPHATTSQILATTSVCSSQAASRKALDISLPV